MDKVSSIFKSIVNGFKTTAEDAWNDFQHLFTNEVEPFLKQSALLIEQNGGTLLLKIAQDALPLLASNKFGEVVQVILSDAKAAGIVTIAELEQLAAATALQFAQNLDATTPAVETPADGADLSPATPAVAEPDPNAPDLGPVPNDGASASEPAAAAEGETSGAEAETKTETETPEKE